VFEEKKLLFGFPLGNSPYSIYNPACRRQVIKNKNYSKGIFTAVSFRCSVIQSSAF